MGITRPKGIKLTPGTFFRPISIVVVLLCVLSNFRMLSIVQHGENEASPASPSPDRQSRGGDATSRLPESARAYALSKTRPKKQQSVETISLNPTPSSSGSIARKDSLEGLSSFSDARYFVYSDETIVQRQVRDDLKYKRGDTLNHPKMPFIREAHAEVLILDALEKHPLRTLNPDEADLFIIPTSTSAILMKRTPEEATQIHAEAFDALIHTPTFKATGGNRHVLVSTALWGFSHRTAQQKKVEGFGLPQHYDALMNVTVANDMDYAGCRELSKTKKKRVDFIEHFRGTKGGLGKATRSDFSLGLMTSEDIPYHRATYAKFMRSTNFLFYHVRDREFIRNSTPFRRAPKEQKIIEGLPTPSSIGPGLPYNDWLREFPDSKFCLAIRGDTPHSHALLRAVKVGCIPVVVCDSYPLYAPTLKSSVDMREYAIFIPEKDFLQDPLRELLKLNELTESEIRSKLDALAFAQRVVLPDHPDSLFVPAFLREALAAQKVAMDPSDMSNL